MRASEILKELGYDNLPKRDKEFVEEIIEDVLKIVNLKEELLKFQFYLHEKGLINIHDWVFKEQANKYLKKKSR
jgi:hypothetical protein